MKKTLKRSLSLLTCIALLLTVLVIPPLRAAAADTPHFSLRIEGATNQIFSGSAEFQEGQTLYPALIAALANNKPEAIPETDHITQYGHYIDSIGGDIATSPITSWLIYVNGAPADYGVDSLPLKDGDTIEMFYVGSDTLYPQIKMQPQNPVAGQTVTINVSADATTYDKNWNPIVTHKNVEGANVSFNSADAVQTDANGNVTLTMPSQLGSYPLSVNQDRISNYPLLMRTGNLTVNVGNTPAQPSGGNFNVTNDNVNFNLVDNSSGGKSAILSSSGFLAHSMDSYSHSYTLSIPSGTTLSGSSAWDGSFLTPAPVYNVAVPGSSVRMAVQVGSKSEDLHMDHFATLTLPGQSGKEAGYFNAAGSFTPITNKLTTNAAPTSGEDGYYDDITTGNLIIYTEHFSTFVAYLPSTSISVSDNLVRSAIAGAAQMLIVSGSNDYWAAFALARSGHAVPSGFLADTVKTLSDIGGSFDSATSLAMTIIGLRAAGADPQNFNRLNLVQKLYSYQGLDQATLNSPIYALLALDSGNYPVPGTALWNDQNLVSIILDAQNPNGSFSLNSSSAGDPDITAMAITALAPHLSEAGVADAVSAAVTYLSGVQTNNGGFIPAGGTQEASESIAQTVIALSSVGIDPLTDSRFIKNGQSLLSALMSYKDSDGGFKHTLDASSSDTIATEQALMALSAYQRYMSGSPRLFDLTGTDDGVTSVAVDNPKTGSAPLTPVLVTIPCMLAIIAAASAKKKRR